MKIQGNRLELLENKLQTLLGARGKLIHGEYMALLLPVLAKTPDILGVEYESESGESLEELNEENLRGIEEFADSIKQIKREDVEGLDEEFGDGSSSPDPGFEPDPDFTRPGRLPHESPWTLPYRAKLEIEPDGSWEREFDPTITCGKHWIQNTNNLKNVPNCHDVNYQEIYKETLLRAVIEAHRICARTRCEKVLAWIEHSKWGCVPGNQAQLFCNISLVVICTAL